MENPNLRNLVEECIKEEEWFHVNAVPNVSSGNEMLFSLNQNKKKTKNETKYWFMAMYFIFIGQLYCFY